jgi:shikimate kinase
MVCGFMGSGKTTFVESFRGNHLGIDCVDLDTAVAASLGILPSELGEWINNNGLDNFRHKEITILKGLLSNRMMKIIALGGGTVECEGYTELHSLGKTVFLNVPFETCFNRIKNDPNRPLTAIGEAGLFKIYNQRLPKYLTSDLCLSEAEIKEIVSLTSLVHNLSSI